jgi:uncharacterized SAM-binding protein YcdF (DUF218 family)
MFFIASKLFWIVVEPLNALLLVGLAGVALVWGGAPRLGRRLACGALIAIALICYSPLSGLLLRPLEDRFPQPPADMPPPDGIIVLGGGLDADRSAARGQITLGDAGSRLTTAVALARRFPQARLVFSGGSASLTETGVSEAILVRRLWRELGVPETQTVFEETSRNTFENAVFTRDLLMPRPAQRWLLVTSAWHMPRSMGIFRRAGFSVVAYPTAYLTYGDARDFSFTHVATDSLTRLDDALHEWVGLVAYRLTDKTDALFPAP